MAEPWAKPIIGGHVSLDFVNTVAWRLGEEVREDLCAYSDWIRWAGRVGLLAREEVELALGWAERHPAEAEAVLVRVVGLREAIYRVLRAQVDGCRPPEADLALINEAVREAYATIGLRVRKAGFLLELEGRDDSIPALWRLIRSTADLLISPELGLLRVCAGRKCGWLFLDRSRNRARRWCRMGDCGNLEKARRYYRRHKAS